MERTKVNYIISRYMHGDRQGLTDAQILDIYNRYINTRKIERLVRQMINKDDYITILDLIQEKIETLQERAYILSEKGDKEIAFKLDEKMFKYVDLKERFSDFESEVE